MIEIGKRYTHAEYVRLCAAEQRTDAMRKDVRPLQTYAQKKARLENESKGRIMQKLGALTTKLELYMANAENKRLRRRFRAENTEAERARISREFRERVLGGRGKY
jgi:hypothetical protein